MTTLLDPRTITTPYDDLSTVGVIIPTCNASKHWAALHGGLSRQGLDPKQVLVIDSDSTDGTRDLARAAGYQVVRIERSEFSHGGTRQAGCELMSDAEVLIYLTQDAQLADDHAILVLAHAFRNAGVGAAYGRQMPRAEADLIERHARLFNYPDASSIRSFADRHRLGIKSIFFSNSFAAYRRTALEGVGGFPVSVIMAEDSVVAARLLIAGWCVAYEARAAVVHSHPLSIHEEFQRYFDTGVHHARERWILNLFGAAGGEGKRFLLSELHYLLQHGPHMVPRAILRTGSKYLAYQLGLRESHLSVGLKAMLSSQPRFWHKGPDAAEGLTGRV